MAFNEDLAARVRPLVCRKRGFSEKKMFGGMGYLLNGNMCCGVWKEFLILRIGPKLWQDALGKPFVREFDITGRSMTGWIMVEPDGTSDAEELKFWVELAIRFAGKLPPK